MKGKINGNDTSRGELWIRPLTGGTLIGLAIILIVFVLMALLMSFGLLPLSSAPATACIAIAVGSFFGGFYAAKKLTKNGLIIGAVCGFALFLLFTLIGMAAFKTAPGTSTLIRLLVFVLAAAIGGIIGVGNSGKRKIV